MHRSSAGRFIRYFKKPMLGVSAVTSYGLPNAIVHFPVVVIFLYLGGLVCRAELKPLITVYFIIALYIGRDMAALSYRSFIMPVCVWTLFVPFVIYKQEIAAFLLQYSRPLVLTSAAAAVFLLYAAVFSRWLVRW